MQHLHWLSLIVLSCQRNGRANANFARICSLSNTKVARVKINDLTGEVFIGGDRGDPDDPNRKLLFDEELVGKVIPAIVLTGSNTIETGRAGSLRWRDLQDEEKLEGEAEDENIFRNKNRTRGDRNYTRIINARECTCASMTFSGAFCPLEQDTCGLDREGIISCFTASSKVILVRNAWPIIILWYAALIMFLLFTTQGRHARHFVVVRCCKRDLNERSATRILQPREPQQQEARQEDVEEPPLRHLALKTKRFVAPNEMPKDEEPPNCTICFGNLEDGERIGVLPCEHIFHAECLKVWLVRRNVCPLCQRTEVAVPHHVRGEGEQQQTETRSENTSSRRSLEVTQENEEEGRRGGPFRGRVILQRRRR